MVDSNKIGSLTRTWPSQPVKKNNDNKNERFDKKKDEEHEQSQGSKDDLHKDPGDTIIDEYV